MKQAARSVAARILAGRTLSSGGRVRFSGEAREAALEHVRRRRAEGATVAAAAREIGVEYRTLREWMQAGRASLRPVSVVPPPRQERELALVLPCGIRVECLSLGDVLELARELR